MVRERMYEMENRKRGRKDKPWENRDLCWRHGRVYRREKNWEERRKEKKGEMKRELE